MPPPHPPSLPQSANRLLAATWEATLPAAGYQYNVVKFNGECCVSEIERLAEEGRRAGARAIIGCGGGKVGVRQCGNQVQVLVRWRSVFGSASCSSSLGAIGGSLLWHETS